MPALWFEDCEVGKTYDHPIRRTVTESDNIFFSALTYNPQPLHIDKEFCKATEWGQPLMNSLFTLGLMVGISVNDLTTGTIVANLGMTDVKFPAPLFQGDTINVSTRVAGNPNPRRLPRNGRARAGREAHDFIVMFVGIKRTSRSQRFSPTDHFREQQRLLPSYWREEIGKV